MAHTRTSIAGPSTVIGELGFGIGAYVALHRRVLAVDSRIERITKAIEK